MFVVHLDARLPGRMRALLAALEQGTAFPPAFECAFGTTPAAAWAELSAPLAPFRDRGSSSPERTVPTPTPGQ